MTERKIQDYLHFYIGCEGLSEFQDICMLVSVDYDNSCTWKVKRNKKIELINGTIEDIRPILRPILDMTDEEKIELANVFGWTWSDDTYKINQVNSLFAGNGFYNRQTNIVGNKWCQVFQFLLSKSFDLFNLIPDGLAIDKNCIK